MSLNVVETTPRNTCPLWGYRTRRAAALSIPDRTLFHNPVGRSPPKLSAPAPPFALPVPIRLVSSS